MPAIKPRKAGRAREARVFIDPSLKFQVVLPKLHLPFVCYLTVYVNKSLIYIVSMRLKNIVR